MRGLIVSVGWYLGYDRGGGCWHVYLQSQVAQSSIVDCSPKQASLRQSRPKLWVMGFPSTVQLEYSYPSPCIRIVVLRFASPPGSRTE